MCCGRQGRPERDTRTTRICVDAEKTEEASRKSACVRACVCVRVCVCVLVMTFKRGYYRRETHVRGHFVFPGTFCCPRKSDLESTAFTGHRWRTFSVPGKVFVRACVLCGVERDSRHGVEMTSEASSVEEERRRRRWRCIAALYNHQPTTIRLWRPTAGAPADRPTDSDVGGQHGTAVVRVLQPAGRPPSSFIAIPDHDTNARRPTHTANSDATTSGLDE